MKRLILASALLASCGSEKSNLDIVNGQKVYRSFYGRFEVGGGFRCGSTLIGDGRWSLTASHCLPSKHRDKIKVRFGAFDMNKPNNAGKPFDLVKVIKVIEHPREDLALLKLERPAKFNPVGFANKNYPNGYRLQAFGMGNKALGVGGGGILRGAVLEHVKGPNPNIIYTKAMPRGVCHGDSGGPLIDPKSRKLVGIAKWTGSKCASVRGRDGFTRPDIQWIRSNMR